MLLLKKPDNLKNNTLENLYLKAKELSGPLHSGSGEIYSSYTHPLFNHKGIRNTKERLDQLGVPSDLTNCVILDLGCNTGAISLELTLRNATVIGLEYNLERVQFCRDLFSILGLNGTFEQIDFNTDFPDWLSRCNFDYIFSLSVDGYLNDPCSYFKFLSKITNKVLYIESNYPSSESKDLSNEINFIKNCLKDHFYMVKYLNYSSPKGRRLFICSHRYLDAPRTTSNYDGNGWYVKEFASVDGWKSVKECCKHLKNTSSIPEIIFPEECIMKIKKVDGICIDQVSSLHFPSIKKQLIDLILKLNSLGLAHRDLHIYNLLFDEANDYLWVVDWEHVCFNKVPLNECYDLTGNGCDLPGVSMKIGPQYIFSSHASIGKFLGLF